MKKLAYLSLFPLVTASLVACRNNGGPVDDRRVVTMEYVEAGFGNTPYLKLKEAFEKANPEIRLALVPNAQMAETTAVRIANGTASDLMIYNRTVNDIKLWTASGYIEDLTSFFDEICEGTETVKDRLDDNALKASYFRGKYYTIPEYYNINGFVYNSTVFEDQGWTVPTTTKEFDDLCMAIENTTLKGGKKIKPLVYCASADGYLYYADQGWFSNYLGVSNLDEFYNFKSAEVYNPTSVYGDAKLKGLTLQKTFFFDKGYQVDGSSTLTHIEAQSKLLNYDAAMMLNGSWLENEIKPYITQYSPQLKMFAIPEISDDQNVVLHAEGYTGGTKGKIVNAEFSANMFIPSKAQHKADAKILLKWLCTREACEIWTKYSNAVKPMKYDYTPENQAYSSMSEFGKSVLEIANNYTVYVPISNAEINIVGGAGYRPLGYWFWKFNERTPSQCVSAEYSHCSDNWADWQRLAKETFGD